MNRRDAILKVMEGLFDSARNQFEAIEDVEDAQIAECKVEINDNRDSYDNRQWRTFRLVIAIKHDFKELKNARTD